MYCFSGQKTIFVDEQENSSEDVLTIYFYNNYYNELNF